MITQIVLPEYPPSQNLQSMQESIQIAIIEDLKDVAWTLKELFNLEEDLVGRGVLFLLNRSGETERSRGGVASRELLHGQENEGKEGKLHG